MSNYSRYFLAEQVMFRLQSGIPDTVNKIEIEDVIAAIGQKVNSMLKLQTFTETFQMGDTIPNNLMIATYNDIPITSSGTRCTATLPIQPISLPRNMGVYMVDRYDDFRCPFIPIQAGLYALLKCQPGISDLLGQCGYELFGNELWMTKNLTTENVSEIHVRLLVLDMASYDDYTGLPLPQDYADKIIEDVYKSFMPVESQQMVQGQVPKLTIK